MTGVSPQMIEQTLAEILRETARAHFLRTPVTDEALVALRIQYNQLRASLGLDSGQDQLPEFARLPERLQCRLAAELTWIEHAIAVLQKR